jgi:hypothetical protein
MPMTYCSDCGAKNEYRGDRPRFCGSCGEAFDKAIAVAKRNASQHSHKKKRWEIEQENADEIETEEILDMINFDASSIKVETNSRRMTIGDLQENKEAMDFSRGSLDQDLQDIRTAATESMVKEAQRNQTRGSR